MRREALVRAINTHLVWVHRTMDLCDPVAEVIDLVAEVLRKG
jgi:hypothetical protein